MPQSWTGWIVVQSGAVCISFYAQSYPSILLATLLHKELAHRDVNPLTFLSFLPRHKWLH